MTLFQITLASMLNAKTKNDLLPGIVMMLGGFNGGQLNRYDVVELCKVCTMMQERIDSRG